MELVRAEIRQVRSIKRMTVPFEEDDCIVLLGINESGKSSILRALSFLSPLTKAVPDDLRQIRHDEPAPETSSVEFVFRLSESDTSALGPAFSERTRGIAGTLRLRRGDELLDIEAFAKRYAQTLPFTVDVATNGRRMQYWARADKDELALEGEWLVPSPRCPPAQQVNLQGVGSVPLQSLPFIEKSARGQDMPEKFLSTATAGQVEELFWSVILQVAEQNLPECIPWSFTEDSVLPASVSFEDFIKAPGTFPVLTNMFELAGYPDVAAAVQDWRRRSNGMRTLLNRVGSMVSKELQALWTDKNVSVFLSENGTKLECAIQDAHGGVFNFKRRSDGFRRFASFMLMVSTRARAGKLDGAVLLYDEPDASLHPEAARQLRKELLSLSQRCKVAYSTHSIFMVDPSNVGRHHFVTRTHEETSIVRARPGNIRDEEVLYQAVGHTIFAELSETNILVEGYRDRRLLEVALEAPAAEAHARALASIGRCHARGVKNIPAVTAMLDLIRRSYFILTDSDPVAVQYQGNHKGPGEWRTYAELVGDTAVLTAEDFVRAEKVALAASIAARDAPELAALAPLVLKEDLPILRQLDQALGSNGVEKERRKVLLNAVKEQIFTDLTPDGLRPNALLLVERLAAAVARLEGP